MSPPEFPRTTPHTLAAELLLEILEIIARLLNHNHVKLCFADLNSFAEVNRTHSGINHTLWQQAVICDFTTGRNFTHIIRTNDLLSLRFFLELSADIQTHLQEIGTISDATDGLNFDYKDQVFKPIPLKVTAELDRVEMARLLLQHHGDVLQYELRYRTSHSANHAACSDEMVDLLFEYQADPNHHPFEIYMPLHYDAMRGNIDMKSTIHGPRPTIAPCARPRDRMDDSKRIRQPFKHPEGGRCIAAGCKMLGPSLRRRSAHRLTPGARWQYLWDLRPDRKSESEGFPDRTFLDEPVMVAGRGSVGKRAPTAEAVMEKDSLGRGVGGRRIAAQNTGSDGSLALDTGRNIQWLGELNLPLSKLLVADYKVYSESRHGVTKKSLCRLWGATLGVAQNDPTGVCVERAAGRLVQAFDKAHELALSANFLNETEDGSIIANTQQLQAICPEYVILRPVLSDGFISRNRNKADSSSDVQPPAFTAQRKRKRQPSVRRSVEPASAKRNDHGNLMNLCGDISSITASAKGKGKALFREDLTPGLPDTTPKTGRTYMPYVRAG
jgi:hypothetical protein